MLSQSAVTGEHTCIVLRALENDEVELKCSGPSKWLQPFNQGKFESILFYTESLRYSIVSVLKVVLLWSIDFKRRFMSLLGSCFRSFAPALALRYNGSLVYLVLSYYYALKFFLLTWLAF